MTESTIRRGFGIYEITEAGHIRYGEYGYDRTFKYSTFDTIEEAYEYLEDHLDDLSFSHEYVILPTAEKVWAG